MRYRRFMLCVRDGRFALRSLDVRLQAASPEARSHPVAVERRGAAASVGACVDAESPSRFIAVHFPRWPLDATRVALWRALLRLRESGASGIRNSDDPGDLEQGRASGRRILRGLLELPSVVVEDVSAMRSSRTARIIECCPRAAELGLSIGMSVAQAESVSPRAGAPAEASVAGLAEWIGGGRVGRHPEAVDRVLARFIVGSACAALVLRADEPAWGVMLRRLAACLERWVPRIAVDEIGVRGTRQSQSSPQTNNRCSLLGDLAGCAALFRAAHGTEQTLMWRIADSFARRGFETQLATASTIGAALALARYGRREQGLDCRCRALPPGREADALDPLPVEALRIPPAAVHALQAVEVRTIGQLAQLKRGGVAARLSARFDDESVARPAARGASRGHRRGRKAGQMPAASLFDQPCEGDENRDASDLPRDGGALIGGRDMTDPLLRLDQALGRAPEALIPLRMQEPIVFIKTFEGPASRLDALFLACGELLDQLATTLESRREGMRLSRWTFRHAELPSDLSTDAFVLDAHHGGRPAAPYERMAVRRMISELELRLSAPTASRTHLWAMLRPKLEHIPLDHGVEEIELQLEDAARMRSIQRRLLWRQSLEPQQMHRSPSLCTTQQSKGPSEGEIRPRAVWSGIEGMSPGWVSVGRAPMYAENGEAHSSDSASLQEWIDLVAARIGRERVHRMLEGTIDDLGDGPEGGAVHLGQRPSQRFVFHEPAVIVGGRSSAALAACIAERRSWCAEPSTSCQSSETMAPMLQWRGRLWPLLAIDGWERIGGRWWDGASDPEASNEGEFPQGESVAAPARVIGRAAAIARLSGRLHARLQIGTGLWLFARFPDRIAPPVSHSGVCDQVVPEPPAQDASDGGLCCAELVASHRHRDQLNDRWNDLWNDRWNDRCEHAFEAGLAIVILGAWG